MPLSRIASTFLLGWLACVDLCAQAIAQERHTYLIKLSDAPAVEHAQQRIQKQPSAKALGGAKQALRSALNDAEGVAYLRSLELAHAQILDMGNAALGRALVPRHAYSYTTNGMAIQLTDSEATRISALPGVVAVRRERIEHPLTDAGPQWIGADALWKGQVSGIAATKGEGVVVGVIDTGINPTHPSFAATGADGYTHTNPRGHFYGLCTNGQATCNTKLIGIYDFTDEGTSGVDSVGHGSHVSGIAAGNAQTNALQGYTVALPRNVSGVAPHANLIMYKACLAGTTDNPEGGCPESDLIAAIDQAVVDGVDVINYSIGGESRSAYELLDDGNNDAAAFFQARAAGIVIVAAAGNDGPGAASLGEPGNAPWIIGVANASHNRRFANSIGDFTGASDAPPTLTGQGYTSGYGPANIVYAGDFGNALCGKGDSEGVTPTGASNPFSAGTFHGEIVICDRGTYARVEKGYNVQAAGAGGFILANSVSDAESIVSDNHFLPAVHLGFNEASQLKGWVSSSGTHNGTISGVSAVLDDSFGDILDASSSRGPYGYGGGILKPDITAPGDNILSATQTGTGLALLTGTSMASPHVAGSAALLIAAHPTWSPSQVESALLGTALGGSVRKEDAITLATPLDAGAGRAQPATAARVGLYLPLSADDIRAQDPSKGGDPSKLNRTGIESETCFGQCTFTRTLTDMSGGGTWQISASASANAKVTITPTQFALASGASQKVTIAVDVSDPHLPGSWVYGNIILHKSTGGQSASDTALTLAVYSSPGTAPAFQQITASAPTGTTILQVGGLTALPKATFSSTYLAQAVDTQMSLGVDPTPNDLYSKFPGTGKQFILIPISAVPIQSPFETPELISRLMVVEVTSDAQETRLTAGVDSNGSGQPDAAEEVCDISGNSGSTLRCIVDLRDIPLSATNAWVLVDVPAGKTSSTYSITISAGVPSVSPPPTVNFSNLITTGPGHVPALENFPVRLVWGPVIPDGQLNVTPGKYYGALLIDALPGLNGQAGFVPFSFTLTPGGNDIADALEPNALRNYVIEPGESMQHVFIDIPASGSLALISGYSSSTPNGNLSFYAARADFPASSSSPEIPAAPSASSAATSWTLNTAAPEKVVTIPVTPGRWYVSATNAGPAENLFSLIAQFTPNTTEVPMAPGAYFNPQRSGHGIFLSQASGQQAMYWYSYQEDGTPVWYGAQAAVPTINAATWTAPLFRVSWDGATINSYTVIGNVVLTPINATDFMYSWHVNGSSGSEHFTLLGPDACVPFNGAQADFTGQWFAPAQSGYGMDVLALPSQQFNAFYFYDALGEPRWAAGSTAGFSANTTEAMNQLSGFCPTCAYVPTVASAIGTLTVNYSSPTAGTYATSMSLAAPMSGEWNINQPIARLTGSLTCPE